MDPFPSLNSTLDKREVEVLEQALSASSGNVTRAALLMRTSRVGLYKRMRRLGIDYRAFRSAAVAD